MRMTKMAANRGLDADTDSLIVLETMTCNVVHHSADAKEGVAASGKAQAKLDRTVNGISCPAPMNFTLIRASAISLK